MEEGGHDLAGQLHARVGAVGGAGPLGGGVDDALDRRIDEAQVGGSAGLEALALVLGAADEGRRGGQDAGDVAPGHAAGLDHRGDDDRQGRLQARHAEGAGGPLAVLVLHRVGGVVGADDVDGAVGQRLAHGLDVLGGAQRRVDLVQRRVGARLLIGEHEVVRRDLGGDVDSPGLGPADDVDAARGGQVAHVQARADVLGQEHVAGDDRLLGDGGPAPQAELGGQGALVHLGALGEAGVLGVLGDDAVEGLDVLQGSAHEDGVGHALAVVGEDAHAGLGGRHGAHLGQVLALKALGDGAHGVDVDPAGLAAEAQDLLDDAGVVLHGVGVGHGEHGRVPADGGGAGSGEDGLGVLAAGLAQVGVDVDQARQSDEAGGVVAGGAGGRLGGGVGADRGDGAVDDEDVGGVLAIGAGTGDEVGGHSWFPSSARRR